LNIDERECYLSTMMRLNRLARTSGVVNMVGVESVSLIDALSSESDSDTLKGAQLALGFNYR
jgi:hypothetical protein